MTCTVSCSIAAIFLIGMLYMSYAIDKCSLNDQFMKTLSSSQQDKYKSIMKERRSIYFGGYLFGFTLSMILVYMMPIDNKASLLCLVASTTFISSYFFYIMYPKQPLMILDLDEKIQRKEWVKIYKKMQYHYHMGLVLGIIAVMFFTHSMC